MKLEREGVGGREGGKEGGRESDSKRLKDEVDYQ